MNPWKISSEARRNMIMQYITHIMWYRYTKIISITTMIMTMMIRMMMT